MMGRAAKWKLKFWPDVEVFIFALEITSQIAIKTSAPKLKNGNIEHGRVIFVFK